ncbi:hypothetical protein LXL04_000631 [Taraxacum kok-saghyz]
MPTPVSSARQCLTDEAARALDDAVAVARRRCHSQTTSLHAVSALLSLPTSTFRDACARARSSAYSPRLQFRALELCVTVSLDRLPSSKSKTPDDEPPVSNSLMAAIKRSQANQRRHPETFHLYQMHQQLHSSQTSLSCVKVELKHFILSILDDPIVSRVFGDAGFRSTDIKIAILHPPSASGYQKPMRFPPLFLCNLPDSNTNRAGFNFPFAVDQGEEDFKRIGQVLAKKISKNPLLIGVSADSVLAGFTDSIKTGKTDFLPTEIEGLTVINIEKKIREFSVGNSSEDIIDSKLKEVRDNVDTCTSSGVIVNLGELKLFLDGKSSDYLVSQLSNLVKLCCSKLWLIGSVGSYETYMKLSAKFPAMEKEWDLNLLPITSSKLSTGSTPLKSSLMGSFVPFGGFFPVENTSRNADQSVSRCEICNEKFEQEVSVVVKGGRSVSVADQQSAVGLSSWLQNPESDANKGNCGMEAVDHGGVFNARVAGLQRKWNDICHRLHRNPSSPQITTQLPFPHQFQPGPKQAQSNSPDSNSAHHSPRTNLSPPIDFFTTTSSSPPTSITTDLGLGTIYVDPTPQAHYQIPKSFEKDFKQLYKALADKVGYQYDSIRAISQTITQCRIGEKRRGIWLMLCGPDRVGKKKISEAIGEVVFGDKGSLISVDLNFENQIRHWSSVFDRSNVNFSDLSFRGKTITDFIGEELTKKPRSIVLLEHLDKADFVTKENLSRAIKTGKLSDSRGREIRITDAIFVTTLSGGNEDDGNGITYSEERVLSAKPLQMRMSIESVSEPGNTSVLLKPTRLDSRNLTISNKRKVVEIGDFEIFVPGIKKLKSAFDLNLPVDETEDSEDETEKVWLEEFMEQINEKVVLKPFDFDSTSETILKEISVCFQKSTGSNTWLEIENEVIVQILASCWLSDRKDAIKNWIDTTLYRGFMEAKNHGVNGESMVKLMVEGVMVKEDDVSCLCLPKRIMVK